MMLKIVLVLVAMFAAWKIADELDKFDKGY